MSADSFEVPRNDALSSPCHKEGRIEKIRIVLVDDHAVMRQGLVSLLREEKDMEVVGEAGDGVAAIEIVRQALPDVVLMDVSLPKLSGVEATRIICSELPKVKVIALSMFAEADLGVAMRRAGATAYRVKSDPADALLAAIRAAAYNA